MFKKNALPEAPGCMHINELSMSKFFYESNIKNNLIVKYKWCSYKVLFFLGNSMQPRQKSYFPVEGGRTLIANRKLPARARLLRVNRKCITVDPPLPPPPKKSQKTASTDGQVESYTTTDLNDVVSSVAEKMLPHIKILIPFYLED